MDNNKTAQTLAKELLTLPEEIRNKGLAVMEKNNKELWVAVIAALKEIK